jgi:Flp pilus assembly pilin Flp
VLHEQLLSAVARTHAWGNDLRRRLADPIGATAVEYAIMLAFIAAVIVGAVALLGRATNSNLEKVVFP